MEQLEEIKLANSVISPPVASSQGPAAESARLFDEAVRNHKNGRLAEAANYYQQSLHSNPDNAEAHNNLGVILEHQGQLHEAAEHYRQALAIKPYLPDAHNNLGNLLRRRGCLDEAIAHYRQAVTLKPDHALALFNLGLVFAELGKVDLAAEHYRNSIAANPTFQRAHTTFGNLYRAAARFEEAIIHYRKALSINPHDPETRIALGITLAQQGRAAEATSAARGAMDLPDSSLFPHFELGALLARCGLQREAEKHLRMSLARHPEDPQGARLLLASIGLEPPPDRASHAMLERLYASRSRSWDQAAAGYMGAQLVFGAVRRITGPRSGLNILDAGCGTGLVGELVRPYAGVLEGIDLSDAMCEQARRKSIYDYVHHGDLLTFLTERPNSYDLVTSAATLIHFGDLRPVMEAAATALKTDGLFVFTAFPNEANEDGFRVGSWDGLAQGGCYLHGRRYVANVAEKSGFAVLCLETKVHELDQGSERMGLVVALQRV